MMNKTIGSLVDGRETYHVDSALSIREASRYMTDRRVGAVAVLEGDRLAGVISERDIMGRVVAAGRDLDQTRVRDVMTRDLVVAHVDDGRPGAAATGQRGDVGGAGHGRGEVGSHARLFEHVVGPPRGAPAFDRPPVPGGDQHQPMEPGVPHHPRRRSHVGGRVGADEDHLDPGQPRRYPPGPEG